MIYVIFGPTAGGKTKTAVRLSHLLNAPIINADAFQIYQGMDILTGKISPLSPDYKRHYLLDIVKPDASFSVKEFQDIFRKTLDDLLKKHTDVIVCGGTGLYLKACFYDYSFEEEKPDDIDMFEELSNQELWEKLAQVDPIASQNIHPNNRKRAARALTIALFHKLNKTEQIKKQTHELIYQDVKFLFITPERTKLYENINQRVEEMFQQGLVKEVLKFNEQYNLSLTARQAIGIKEVLSYSRKEISLKQAKELIKQRTRQYAKRQMTFLRHQLPGTCFLSGEELIQAVTQNG